MKTQHTPTPYFVFESHMAGEYFIANTDDPADENRTVIAGHVTAENAAFIVRACNAHDDLVEALDLIEAAYKKNGTDLSVFFTSGEFKFIRSALAKAKGE